MVKTATIILLFVPFFTKAQCDSTLLREVNRNGCSIVEMSPEWFGYYWSADKDLDRIVKESKDLRFALDSVEYVNRMIDSTYYNTSYELQETRNTLNKTKRNSTYKTIGLIALLLTLLLCN